LPIRKNLVSNIFLTLIKEFVEEPPKSVVKVCYQVGETMKGISVIVNHPDPVCLEDSQYPDWLWLYDPVVEKELDMRGKAKQVRKKYIRDRNMMTS
jgi:hypothetical protein